MTSANPAARAAQLIAAGFTGGFTHPGTNNEPIGIPAFRTTGMPEELAKTVQKTAGFFAEAIVNKLEASGLAIIDQADLERHADAQRLLAGYTPRTIVLLCPHDHPLIEVVTADRVKLNGRQLQAFIDNAKCEHP